MRVIGLMSGTSADGVDAALVEWPEGAAPKPFELVAFREDPFPESLQARIHELAAGRLAPGKALSELAALDVLLAERFAESAIALADSARIPLAEIDAIASHGQTVAHHPELRATLQIGDPSLIAERTGCTTVADFRPRDIAAGGEGAPLAPFFHFAAFSDPDESRLALNLGGIANLTWLPRGGRADDVIAFDVGPANSLIDGVVAIFSEGRESMDRDGARARRGRVDEAFAMARVRAAAGWTRLCWRACSTTNSFFARHPNRPGASATGPSRRRPWFASRAAKVERTTISSRHWWPLPCRRSFSHSGILSMDRSSDCWSEEGVWRIPR